MYSVSVKSVEYTMNMKKISKLPRKLKIQGHETSKDLKTDIQSLVRSIAIIRDGGCVLRHYPEAGQCGGFRKDGQLILQGEHLITRSSSSTYGDTRNIVCLCLRHHKYFKPQYSKIYWDLIKRYLGPKKWKWVELAELDKKAHKVDWKLTKLALEQELKKLKNSQPKNEEGTFTYSCDFL